MRGFFREWGGSRVGVGMADGRPVRRRRSAPRLWGGVLAAGLLLAGCSGGGGSAESESESTPDPGRSGSSRGASPSAKPSSGPEPGASDPGTAGGEFRPDPDRLPKTPGAALRLARVVAAKPGTWGPGYERQRPYESDPGVTTVLGKDCVWQRAGLPDTALTSFTRHSELPAEGGKGPIRISATVTVHRTVADAEWEMAGTLEEALRCPDQQLGRDERIAGLMSQGTAVGKPGATSDDSLSESGEYYRTELDGPHHYFWTQDRLDRVTVAAVGKGSEGRTAEEVDAAVVEGMGAMLARAEDQLEARE